MTGGSDAFGARLRAQRESAGLSQEELAERSGLSSRAIGNLEHGRTRWPYRDSLNRLADALGLRNEARAEFIAAGRRRRVGPASTADPAVGDASQHDSGRVAPRQLPATVPTFVGRSGDLATLSEMLHQPGGTAVITAINGMAGVGKTTLAVHWAHQFAAEFPDGQLFVNLRGFDPSGAPVRPADAVRLFLDALDVPADRQPPSVEAQFGLYRSLLVGKRMLILLDNARDEAQVRPLLPGSPTCRVVVTSRKRLLGLTALEAAHPLTIDVLSDAEARQMLQQRLGSERVAADPDATARIIALCGHLPLALCLVAAHATARPDLPLARIAADLATHPDLEGFADSEDPMADIRGAFSWSYRQLAADTARVFRLAGLHPGPDIERHTAAALTGATVEQAEHALTMLAHASLIQPTGPVRYGMHDLLRGYAHELTTSQDTEPQRRAALIRLFDYYLDATAAAMDTAFPAEHHRRPKILPAATPVPTFPDEQAALAWLAGELTSLVAVAGYTAENGWASHTTRLSSMLFRYLDTAGHLADASIIHDHARQAARRAGDPVGEADALVCLGVGNGQHGRHREAGDQFEQALALHRRTGNRDGQARALNYLGLVRLRLGRPEDATEDLEQALHLFQAVGERTGAAYALSNLGVISRRQGDYDRAADYQQRALAAFRELDDRHAEASILDRLGLVELSRGRYPQAAELHQQALDVYRNLGDRNGEATALSRLGMAALRQHRFDKAADNLREALSRYREQDDHSGQAETLNGLGEMFLVTGDPTRSRAEHSAALGVASRSGMKHEQARAHHGLATAYKAGGDLRKARHHWQEALSIYTDVGAPEADEVRAELEANP